MLFFCKRYLKFYIEIIVHISTAYFEKKMLIKQVALQDKEATIIKKKLNFLLFFNIKA